jgi:hypothetical protein
MNEPSRAMRALLIESEIQRLLDDEHYALAIVVSQTMLELRVEQEIKNLAEGFQSDTFGEATLEMFSSFNLNGRTRKFVELALGIRFVDVLPSEMEALRFHNERRNRIVHAGAAASGDDAHASFQAVRDMTWRLHQLVYRRIGWDLELEEDEKIRREEEGIEPESEGEF